MVDSDELRGRMTHWELFVSAGGEKASTRSGPISSP